MADNDVPKLSLEISAGIVRLKSDLARGDAEIKAWASRVTREYSSSWDAGSKAATKSIRQVQSEVERQARTQLGSYNRRLAEEESAYNRSIARRKKADQDYIRWWESQQKTAARQASAPTIARSLKSEREAVGGNYVKLTGAATSATVDLERRGIQTVQRERIASNKLTSAQVEKEILAHEKLEHELLTFKAKEADKAAAQAQRHLKEMTAARKAAEKEANAAAKAGAKDVENALVRTGKSALAQSGSGMGGITSSATSLAVSLGPVGIAVAAITASLVAEGVAIGFVGSEMYDLSSKYAEYGAQLYKGHEATGIAVGDLAILKYSADVSGVGWEKVSRGVTMYSKQLYAAEGGNKQAIKSLEALGITQQDIANANGQTLPLFYKLSDALHNNEGGYRKTALAAKELSKAGGPELVTFMSQGSAAMKANEEEMKRYGFAMDEEGAAKARKFQQEMARLDKMIEGFSIRLGGIALPAVLNFVEGLRKIGDTAIAAGSPTVWEALSTGVEQFLFTALPGTRELVGLLGIIASYGKAQQVDSSSGSKLDAQAALAKAQDNLETMKKAGAMAGTLAIYQKDVDAAKSQLAKSSFRVNVEGVDRTAKKGVDQIGLELEMHQLKQLEEARKKAGLRGAMDKQFGLGVAGELDTRIDALKGSIKSKTDVADAAGGALPPGAAGSKAAKDDGYNKLLDAHKKEFFSNEDAILAKARARVEEAIALNKEEYSSKSISYEEYAKKELNLTKTLAFAEKNRIDHEIAATKRHQFDIVDKKGESANSLAAREVADNTAINELKAKREKIDADVAKVESDLHKGQVKANNEFEEFTKSQGVEYLNLLGGESQFAAQRLEHEEEFNKVQRDREAEIARRGGSRNAPGTIGIGVGLDNKASVIRSLKDAATAAAEGMRPLQDAQKNASIEEQRIKQGVSLGIYSELKARDMLLSVQRQEIPALQQAINAQQILIATKKELNADTDEETNKLKELEAQMQTLGVDMDRAVQLGRMMHQMDIIPEHLNDGVREFLSNVKSMQEILTGARTDAVKLGFSVIDNSVDKLTKRFGVAKELAGGLMKGMAHLGAAQLMEKAFGFKVKKPETQMSVTNANTTAIATLTSSVKELNQTLNKGGSTSVSSSGSGGGGYGGGSAGVSTGSTLGGATSLAGVPAMSFGGGSKGATALSQGASLATSPAGISVIKKLGGKFGSLLGLGGGAKAGAAAGGVDLPTNKEGLFGSLGPNGGGGIEHGMGDSAKSTAAMNGLSMGLGIVQGFTNSGGTMGGVESGLMTAGEMAGGPTNPVGIALMASAIGLGLAGKAFGWGKGDEQKIKDAILAKWQIKVNKGSAGDKVLTDLKNIGEQQWPGKVKDHIQDILAIPSAKAEVEAYAEQTGQFNNILVKTAQGTDTNAASNRITRMATGGSTAAGANLLVGDRHGLNHAEVFVPSTAGKIIPNASSFFQNQNMQNSNFVSQMGAGSQAGQQFEAMHSMYRDLSDRYETMMSRFQDVHPNQLFKMVSPSLVAEHSRQGFSEAPHTWNRLAKEKGI